MVTIPSKYRPLSTGELPHSDETPVDNEIQNDIPNLLLNILRLIWSDRQDWFFGVDMVVYKDSKAIVPDGFLALGVPRYTSAEGRLSYVINDEKVVPILALEVVSRTYNHEYEDKLNDYQRLGVLYYVIYNQSAAKSRRFQNRQSLEVYKLINHKYELQTGNPIWMPELELGIGCESKTYASWAREWVFWYDLHGNRYLTESEKIEQIWQEKEQERKDKEQERTAKEKLAAHLRSLGINPDDII